MNKKTRDLVYEKYNGLCAYSGTLLEYDWQVDHVIPKRLFYYGVVDGDPDHIDNLVPAQRLINHYKGGLSLSEFKGMSWLGNLHKKIDKPKNPRTEKSKKTKEYICKIAGYFGVTPDKPFDGIFHFEKNLPSGSAE